MQQKLMAKITKVEILFLLVAATLMPLPHTTQAAEHAVDWIIPSPGASSTFYSSFAANNTFRLNDTLLFKFRTGAHNVVTLSKKNFETCNVSDITEAFNTGPARITLNRTGELYFACAFPSHCSLGQKLSVNVTEGSSSSSPLAPSPPVSRAAMSLAVTVPVLLMALAIDVLFQNN